MCSQPWLGWSWNNFSRLPSVHRCHCPWPPASSQSERCTSALQSLSTPQSPCSQTICQGNRKSWLSLWEQRPSCLSWPSRIGALSRFLSFCDILSWTAQVLRNRWWEGCWDSRKDCPGILSHRCWWVTWIGKAWWTRSGSPFRKDCGISSGPVGSWTEWMPTHHCLRIYYRRWLCASRHSWAWFDWPDTPIS